MERRMRLIFRDDAAIVAKIHAYFNDRFADADEGAAALPAREHMARLLSAAFWASLYREEGFQIKVSLAYFDPIAASRALLFAEPLSLSPKSLAKTSPAVER